MPQSTKEDLLWKLSGRAKFSGLTWTGPDKARDRLVTLTRGAELMEVWRRWKIRQGWTVTGSRAMRAMSAYPPGVEPGLLKDAEHIVLRTFDPKQFG